MCSPSTRRAKHCSASARERHGCGRHRTGPQPVEEQFPEIANLKMPAAGTTTITHVTVEKDGKAEGLLVALRPLEPVNLWQPNAGIAAERLMIGFVVPDREIYATLYAAQGDISAATSRIVKGILASVLSFLVLVLAVSVAISRRFTAGLVALADAAGRLTRADYNVQVPVKGRDEVALVGAAFNSMAREIREYTDTLEQRVADRTRELASATRRSSNSTKSSRMRTSAWAPSSTWPGASR